MGRRQVLAAVVIALALLAAGQSLFAERPVASSKPGMTAPAFRLKGLDGQAYAFRPDAGHERQRPAVLHFWASWCEPCQEEAPQLNQWYKQYKDRIDIYSVNLTSQDRLEGINRFVEQYRVAYPVLLDEKAKAAEAYHIAVLPTAYFIDGGGTIVDRVIGFSSPEAMQRKYDELLQREAAAGRTERPN